MIKFGINDEDAPVLVENDRGAWRLISDSEGCVWVYSGFDSESILTIMLTGRQDGMMSMMVAHAPCDGTIETAKSLMPHAMAEESLNHLVQRLLNYPEHL